MTLFENIAAMDDSHIIAHRKASAVALKRVKDRFGAFMANAGVNDRSSRFSLIADDISEVIKEVVTEYGGDAQKIEAAIKRSMMPMPGQPGGTSTMAPQGQGMGTMGQPQGQTQGQTCPQCGGPMVNGQCPTCQGGMAGGAAGAATGAMGAYGLNHTMPQGPSTGPITAAGGFCDTCHAWKSGPKAGCTCDGDGDEKTEDDSKDDSYEPGEKESSVHTARRPKMCPYHSEVTDISLGSGDPQAGFNSMSAHAWGDKHCKGGYQGSCNFRPAMVTQKFWDDKQAEYDDRRQQRDDESPSLNDLSIDTEPIMHAEPLPDEAGKEGVSDIDGELANAPSAVGAGDLAMAASTKKGEALKTEKLPKGGESALGGPSPKIDKGNSGDEHGWNLKPIDTQMKGSPNPTIEQDPTDKPDYAKEDFLDQTDAVTKSETLPSNSGDAGFDGERNTTQYPTKTFGDNGTDPVTRTSISAVDPDKNPIQEIVEEYEGFLMPNQVESALKSWTVG